MLINPGSHRPQGPWDPNEKKKWIDTTNSWILLSILVPMVVGMALGIIFGYQPRLWHQSVAWRS